MHLVLIVDHGILQWLTHVQPIEWSQSCVGRSVGWTSTSMEFGICSIDVKVEPHVALDRGRDWVDDKFQRVASRAMVCNYFLVPSVLSIGH